MDPIKVVAQRLQQLDCADHGPGAIDGGERGTPSGGRPLELPNLVDRPRSAVSAPNSVIGLGVDANPFPEQLVLTRVQRVHGPDLELTHPGNLT
jgi:hypothetical protein